MNTYNIPPKLENFLKENGCYREFFDNLEHHNYLSYQEYNDMISRALRSAISYAFVWSSTPEGHEFWEKLSGKWHKYVMTHSYQATNNKTTEL